MTQRKTILVVEDDAFIALDLEDVLATAGFTVLGPVATVDEALTLLRKDAPDLAVLDYNLGSETSIDIANTLNDRGVPFLFISGQTKDVVMAGGRHDAKVLPKPFRPAELVRALQDFAASASPKLP